MIIDRKWTFDPPLEKMLRLDLDAKKKAWQSRPVE